MASRSRNRKAGGRHVALSIIPLIGDAPPGEFRIFQSGDNQTSKGIFKFDAVAATAVMGAYAAHGVDLMIDLEHLSILDVDRSVNFDPDARGWCKLELRNGELWATNVTWTPDGVVRLSEKRQRYISPAFVVDDANRIVEVLNIAITAMPATDNIEPLVAASQRIQRLANGEDGGHMTPEQFAAIAEALGLGADANIEDVLATIAAMVKKVQDAANGTETPAAEEPAPEVAAAAEGVPVVAAASRLYAASRLLVRLSGKKDIGAAVQDVQSWRDSHLELEKERAKIATERAVLEAGERRRLVGELVKCGSESPGTAWSDDTATKPAEPWASMPMDALRSRVVKLTKGTKTAPTAGAPKPAPVAAAAGGQVVMVQGEAVELSAREVQTCAELKAKVEDYAANKLIRARSIAQQG